LHLLAEKGYLGSLRSLLESKIDINIKDIRGRTPLHTAILSGEVKIAEELMLRKADVDCKDHNGITPLLLALQYRQTNLVKLLLKY
ncbi:ankyrin repeat protein, partial [Phaeosphaeriaceae sp. PMI808]